MASFGNSNDSAFFGGDSNPGSGTTPVTFRFLTAQGTLPPNLNEVRFLVRDELGNPLLDTEEPLGDPVVLPVPDPGNVSITPQNSTIDLNSELSFVATSGGLDITDRGSFFSSNQGIFDFLTQSPNEGRGVGVGTADITFESAQTVQDLVVCPAVGSTHVKS